MEDQLSPVRSTHGKTLLRMKHVLTVLLAGGAGERLHPLTRDRAKPAVPFGGMYRIIDITLSNCLNSDCKRILVLVQYKSHSLVRHIQYAWDIMRRELGEFIDVIPPQMRVNENWYLGTADALYQNLYAILRENPHEVLILSSDHIYKMDYQKMVRAHRQSEADVTLAAIEVPLSEASRFGVVEVGPSSEVRGFTEKPSDPQPRECNGNAALASMGIYLFNTDVLKQVVMEDAEDPDSSHDFGKDILPKMLGRYEVNAYVFQDENRKPTRYWRDVGTLDSYWESNMDLVEVDPQFNLYDDAWPMRTRVPSLPPAKFVFADEGRRFGVAIDSIVSSGCIVSGGRVKRSVLSPGVRIHSYANVEECILFDGASVGRYAKLRRVIVEKNVQIPEHTSIGYDLEQDAKLYRVTESGIVVVEAPEERPLGDSGSNIGGVAGGALLG